MCRGSAEPAGTNRATRNGTEVAIALYRRARSSLFGLQIAIAADEEAKTGVSLQRANLAPADGSTSAAASEGTEKPSAGEVVAGLVLFLGGLLIGIRTDPSSVEFTPPSGVGAFALFYVLALAIERMLEVFDPLVERLLSLIAGRDRKPVLERDRDKAIAAANNSNSEGGGGTAASAQAEVTSAVKGRTVALAGFAGGLGIVVSDYFNADFLHTIGVTQVRPWLAAVITGLVISGGSKQLHDLISSVSKTSQSKSTPTETAPV